MVIPIIVLNLLSECSYIHLSCTQYTHIDTYMSSYIQVEISLQIIVKLDKV